jgi:uncharacterized membrane protein
MRKDIFIVGARLLGMWLLVGAATSLAVLIITWIGYQRRIASSLEYNLAYNAIHFIVEVIAGLYLLFRTHRLFNFLDGLKPDEEEIEPAGDE